MRKNNVPVVVLLITVVGAFIIGCFSLDPFLFDGDKISSYSFDSYSGKRECSDAIDSLDTLAASEYREISLKSDQETVAAVILGKKAIYKSNDTIIIYYHGNTGHIDYYWPKVRLLYATGYPVMVIDYRGFGKSSGEATETGIYTDGVTALNYLRDSLGNPFVIIDAYSLGSLVGCEMASRYSNYKIAKLILESPIGSVETIGEDGSYLDLPGSYVTTFKGNNAEKIRSVKIPLLWFHGTKDETLERSTNGLLVWNNYSGPEGYYSKVEGAGHGNVQKTMGYFNYIKCLSDFISGHAAGNPLLIAK